MYYIRLNKHYQVFCTQNRKVLKSKINAKLFLQTHKYMLEGIWEMSVHVGQVILNH